MRTRIGWTLVFKAIAGESEVIENVWKDSLTHEEFSFEALNKKNSFKQYYKNRIVRDWTMFNPTEVCSQLRPFPLHKTKYLLCS